MSKEKIELLFRESMEYNEVHKVCKSLVRSGSYSAAAIWLIKEIDMFTLSHHTGEQKEELKSWQLLQISASIMQTIEEN